MKIFEHGREKQQAVVIIGCGGFGAALAAGLSGAGCRVTVTDKNEDAFCLLPKGYAGDRLVGDAATAVAVQKIAARQAAAVIVLTGSDNLNILIAQKVHAASPKTRLIARLNDPRRRRAYEIFQIHVADAEDFFAKEISRTLAHWTAGEAV